MALQCQVCSVWSRGGCGSRVQHEPLQVLDLAWPTGGNRFKRRFGVELGGPKARFFHKVSDAHLARIIKVNLKSNLFTYESDQAALARAQAIDGKLLLVTNVKDMTPLEVLKLSAA